MLSLMNIMVRAYIRKFDKELDEVRYDAPTVQTRELKEILSNELVKCLNQDLATPNGSISYRKLSNYEDYRDKILDLKDSSLIKVHYYAQSSGTSGKAKKLVPTPEYFVKRNHLRGSWYILNTLYNKIEGMNVFTCKNLLIGGAIYERNKKYLVGDVSGIMLNRIPSFFRPFYVPSISVATMPSWDEKLRLTVDAAARTHEVSLLGGVPTWVISVLRDVLKKSKDNKLDVLWPNLKAYIHGGVSLEPYRSQFDRVITDPNFKYIEVYNATEGFFAFQDDPDEEGMLLMLKSGIYFEFVKTSNFKGRETALEHIVPIADVEINLPYVIIITTQTGLIRYVQGDIIKFVSTVPYKVKVIGRITEYINAFGEDLLLNQAEEALLTVAKLHHAEITHYSVGPKYITLTEKGSHEWFIEFNRRPENLTKFAQDLDEAVCEVNSNYHQKRTGEIALECLNIYPLSKNAFKDFLKEKKKLGAQSKVQKLSNDRVIIDGLRKYIL